MMAEEEKKEETKEEPKEEKKEKKGNWFTKTWGNIKKGVSDSNRESNLEKEYCKDAKTFTVYTGSLLTKTFHGKVYEDGKSAEVYGEVEDDELPYSCVLCVEPENTDKELPKYFYVLGHKHEEANMVTLKIKEKVEDKEVENEYQRPLTILTLDPEMVEVKVIKVHDTYYLKKEEEKK